MTKRYSFEFKTVVTGDNLEAMQGAYAEMKAISEMDADPSILVNAVVTLSEFKDNEAPEHTNLGDENA